jgi:hypothetical protein
VFAEIGQVRQDIHLHTSVPNLSRQGQCLPAGDPWCARRFDAMGGTQKHGQCL